MDIQSTNITNNDSIYKIYNNRKFPDEILLNIFSNLNFEERCECARICKNWNFTIAKIMGMPSNINIESVATCKFLISKFGYLKKIERRTKIINLANRGLKIFGGFVATIGLYRLYKNHMTSSNESHENFIKNIRESSSEEQARLLEEYNKTVDSDRQYTDINEIIKSSESTQMLYNTGANFLTVTLITWINIVSFLNAQEIERNYTNQLGLAITGKVAFPADLMQDQALAPYCCSLSGRVTLIPVRDKCGHLFDYIYLSRYLMTNITCPVNQSPLEPSQLKFEAEVFYKIHTHVAKQYSGRNLMYFKFKQL